MVGEALHEIGRDGAIRAKKWLDATTRVKAAWLNTDPSGAQKLSFNWPASGNEFSFDIGGILRGGEFENQMFLAECKKYTTPGGQGTAYRRYLAMCYVATTLNRAITDHFMWITWHPFLVESWSKLCEADEIEKGVVEQRTQILGSDATPEDARAWLDQDLCKEVANRLWLLVLSDRQEKLVITDAHRGLILKYEVEHGGGW
ncbi:hypothetical protein [Micromonospora avicenniae]|uniref:hypothetical protein n=1 Tax=Micromonospora avicenniae TaxID=1198245 RepID=UPI001115A538|nr:hypothetical protein [Micromonospora avicenniae]